MSVKQLIGEKFNLSITANKGLYKSKLFDLIGNDQSQFENKIDYLRGSAEALWLIHKNYKLNFGYNVMSYNVSPGAVQPFNDPSVISPKSLDNELGFEQSYYLDNQFSFFDKIELSLGVRFINYNSLGPDVIYQYKDDAYLISENIIDSISFNANDIIQNYQRLSPRASLRYQLSESGSIKIAYSKTHQNISQISNTASATPVAVWQLSNYHIKPQESDNFSLGVFKNFKENTYATSIEGYYRSLKNIVDYKDFAILLLNENIERDLLFGIGTSYGAEFKFNKIKGNTQWSANYTYGRSLLKVEESNTQESVNNGSWYPANYDIPHILNVNVRQKISEKTQLIVNFTYRKGRPTTAPVSSFNSDNILNVPIYSLRNQFRVPDFHRLDVACNFGPYLSANQKFEHHFSISVYNIYGRKNPYSVFFNQSPFDNVMAIRVAPLGTIFPAINYKINLR